MGKINDVLQRYLSDRERFADLFNAAYFHGNQVVRYTDLKEENVLYKDGQQQRDIKMCMQTGSVFRILALENQNLVDYAMPFRCMQYDTQEYKQQIDSIRRQNDKAQNYTTSAERLCRIKRTDRLLPVYTLCLYHGEKKWDGPRTLKDMMDFGENKDLMSRYFADYPMRLYCLNEETDFSAFHTELRELFMMLQYRQDKNALWNLIQSNPLYREISQETAEAVSVLMHVEGMWEKRKRYLYRSGEEVKYDMCQALQELFEDGRLQGIEQGIERGIEQGIEQGIKVCVALCREFGMDKEGAVRQISRKFALDMEKAQEYTDKYWA